MLVVIQKRDVSNDVGKMNKDESESPDVMAVGNGQPEENSSPVVAVKIKSVADTSDGKSQSDINAAKPEEPVREKRDTNGSSSPVKRKQFREKSDSETEDRGSPAKKPRSEIAKHSSDELHADSSAKMSDEDVDSSAKPSPKKRKRAKEKVVDDDDDDEEEELRRMYCSAAMK